ncbi:MAG: hypothetical protein D6715_10840 [Calditrichaeota bacterium]|nr:MAG: hypothetical protein D6715_10840 [Calditrichota bacterium]
MSLKINQLLEGDLLSGRVVRRLGPYLFEVALLGAVLPVNSNAGLSEGQQVLVQVLKKSPRLHLKFLGTLDSKGQREIFHHLSQVVGKSRPQFFAALHRLLQSETVPLNATHLRKLNRQWLHSIVSDPLHWLLPYALQRGLSLPQGSFREDFLVELFFNCPSNNLDWAALLSDGGCPGETPAGPGFELVDPPALNGGLDWRKELLSFVRLMLKFKNGFFRVGQTESLLPGIGVLGLYFRRQMDWLRGGKWAVFPKSGKEENQFWGVKMTEQLMGPLQGEFFWLSSSARAVWLVGEGRLTGGRLSIRLFDSGPVAPLRIEQKAQAQLVQACKALGYEEVFLSCTPHRDVLSVLSKLANTKHWEWSC